MTTNKFDYWNNFYHSRDRDVPLYPSQFAAFVAADIPSIKRVIDIGCGNGRDADFFARYGLEVVALDASESAIERCKDRYQLKNARFEKFQLGDDDFLSTLGLSPTSGTVLYGRFLLHAIGKSEEDALFNIARDFTPPGSFLALEYRCSGDERLSKQFGHHFRRYINHDKLCNRVSASGYKVIYQITSQGLAKYGSEDALVGRCIAVKVE